MLKRPTMIEPGFPAPDKGRVALYYLGQSGVVIVSDQGTRVAVDPYLTDTVPLTRIAPIVCLPEDLDVDQVFLSHDHSDHTDPNTCLPLMRTRRVEFWGPPSSLNVLRGAGARPDRLHRLDRGSTVHVRDITVHAVHAEHTEDSLGYIFEVSGRVVYHTGDTQLCDELFWLHDRGIQVLLCPFSGRWEAMNAAQAARLADALGVDVVIPIHHDMFAENRSDPQTLLSALASVAGSRVRGKILVPGERWEYPDS